MKKIISSILIVVLLFNFISANTFSAYAATGTGYTDPGGEGAERTDGKTSMENSMTEQEAEPSEGASTDILEEGEVSTVTGGTNKTTTSSDSAGISAVGNVLGVIALIIDIVAIIVDVVLGQLTYCTEYDFYGNSDTKYFLSLERIVFNRVPLFDINFFNIKDDTEIANAKYTVGISGTEHIRNIKISSSVNDIKQQVALVYQITRILAAIIGFLVLLYVGIRMALSVTAEDKANYKNMLIAWVESIVLLFAMPYIMVVFFSIGNMLTNMFFNIEQVLLGSNEIFEDTIRNQVITTLFESSGLELTIWSIMYWCLLFIQAKFFLLYLKRVLMVGFLIVISPLITITYSIDKVGDGKAQSFFVWFKEFAVNVLIQPLHAIIYLVFILTANEIAKTAPLLALAFLLAMGTVEKMVKHVFNLKDLVTLKSVNEFLKKGK